MPLFPTVAAIAPPTPIGANRMTSEVNSNITSESAWQNASPCARCAYGHARPRLREVHREQPHDERERGNELEVEERSDRECSNPFHVVAVSRDPHHERREQERRDQRLDHPLRL